MANPSKKKGTQYETRLLKKLKVIWPALDRAKPNNKSCDFHGAQFPIEAKKRERWDVKEWVRRLNDLTACVPRNGGAWALFIEDGDLRSADSAGEVMVVSGEFGRWLLSLADQELQMQMRRDAA